MIDATPTKTTCPYCGVGCGVLASVGDDGRVSVRGDPDHPANRGRLCSKGSALGETVDLNGRLLYPEIAGEQASWTTALDLVAQRFSAAIAQHGPDSVAFYVSGQLLTEDYYIANKLMKGYIGSANIDTNSRLCMSSSVAGHKRAFGSDTVPCNYEDLEQAQLIVLVGSNAAWCHPVLYQRIVRAKQDRAGYQVIVIDPRRTDTADLADVFLPIAPGSDVTLFNGLLVYLADHGYDQPLYVQNYTSGADEALQQARVDAPTIDVVAERCGLSTDAVLAFYTRYAQNERVITVYSQGVNQSAQGTDKVNAIINCHLLTGRIGRLGMGPFSFTGQPNAMGGREVGGLANQLAAHMDVTDATHRELVRAFWNAPCIADKPGLKAVDLFRAVDEGRIKALWIMATNPAVSMPDADIVRRALERCEFVVVSDVVRNTDTTTYAHVLLPAAGWGEKSGTVTNSERRISRQRDFLPVPGEAKPDWWIVREVATRMGFGEAFAFASAADIFREHAALSAFRNEGQRDFDLAGLAQIGDSQYDALAPVQWPVNVRWPQGRPRFFNDGEYFHADRKARLVPVAYRAPVNVTNESFPLILNTGRVRDQWHTMTRTAKAPRLNEHRDEPYVEIHPADAQRYGVVDGALARVVSTHGEVIVRARSDDRQRRGSVFVPMHWNRQFSALAVADALVAPHTDPISGQPQLKYTPVRVSPAPMAWHGFLLTRRELKPWEHVYWTGIKGDGYWRYELAGTTAPAQWPALARQWLCASDTNVNWTEYYDARAARYRGARWVGTRLESCLFVAPEATALPDRAWLSSLFAIAQLSDAERQAVLLGKPLVATPDLGPTVCACFSVKQGTIVKAIQEQGLRDVATIGSALKAGTNCGSCIPELKRLLLSFP